MPDQPLTPTSIRAALRTAAPPGAIRCYGQVGSTMDLARELLPQAPEADLPLLVTAEEQTAGRGRLGRPWLAPPGSALLLSLGLRPGWLAPARSVALVWAAAVALCEAVEQVARLPAELKWPNDLLLPVRAAGAGQAARAKAAGILLELSYAGPRIESAIVGVGVNVSAAPPPELTRYPATSLAAAAGAPVDRLALLGALLERVAAWQGRLRAGDDAALLAAWRGRLNTLGRHVTLETPAGPLAGLAEGVAEDGSLLLRDGAGLLHRVSAGDVGLI